MESRLDDHPERASSRRPERRSGASSDAIKPLLIRVPVAILGPLQEEARRKDSSVNSLIVSVLRNHSRWGRFQQRLGFMPLHKSMIIQLMDKVDEQELEQIGRNQKDQTTRDVILFSNSNYDFGTFLDWVKLRCELLGFQLLLRDESRDGSSVLFIMINHGLGIKWSHYYKGMFETVLQEVLKPGDYDNMKFELTSSSFSMTIAGSIGSKLPANSTFSQPPFV